ncbi:uncharacterized protein [Miscanthus floridulus]|uniref:uncharacterized protein n=1 Tax=Miscanthus floridulus TaxID=154761 RepID=UPI00345A8F49
MGSTAEVERATAGVTQPPPQRAEGTLKSSEGRPVPADMVAAPLPPSPPPPRARDAVRKILLPRSSWKHQVEAPALAPLKALKAALQRGAASARADPKEPVAQGEAIEASIEQAGEEAPSIAEATEGEAEAPITPEAVVAEAGASRASEVEVADAGSPRTTKAEVAEVGAPGTTKAEVAETEAGQAPVPPPVQDLPPSQESAREVEVQTISSDDTSRGKEVADAEAASIMEQPVPTPAEGSSALVRVRPEPCGWDSLRILWRSRDDPKGEPLFALEDVAEGGRWSSLEQFCQLAERSLRTALSVVAEDLPGVTQELEARSLEKSMFLRRERDVWDQLRQQNDLLAGANDLLSVRSTEVEDLRLRCADIKAEATMAREKAAPLAARIQELEEELTRAAGERDTFRSWAEQEAASAKAAAEQLEAKRDAHRLTKGALAEAVKVAEASRVEALAWKEKAEGLEKEAFWAAEASIAM